MTVAAQSPINTYIGDGSTSSFSFSFPVFNSSQILVEVTNSSGTTALILGTDYTVSGLNVAGTPASAGSISLINSSQAWLSSGKLASGYTLSIQANFSYEQDTSIRNQGSYLPEVIEDAFDNLEYQIQQLALAVTNLQTGAIITYPNPSTILTDTVTGKTFQLQVTNGQFGILELT